MEPRELVRRLIDTIGETPNSIVHQTRPKMTQSTLHRYLTKDTGETRRKSLQPLADFLQVPLDAFYDQRAADAVAVARGIAFAAPAPPSEPLMVREPATPFRQQPSLNSALDALGAALQALPADARAPVGLLLDRWAQSGGAETFRAAIEALLQLPGKPKP